MQPYEMTGEDLRILFCLSFFGGGGGDEEEEQQVECTGIQSFPAISARTWRSVENMLVHIMIESFQLISEKQ